MFNVGFNVGEKVKIRKNLSAAKDSYSSSFGVNDCMERFRGKEAIITEVYKEKYETSPIKKYKYFLDIDDGEWT